MNDQIIEKLVEWIKSSSDFVNENLPDYVNQYLRSELIKTWLGIICMSIFIIIMLIICVISIYKYYSYERGSDASCIVVIGCIMPISIIMMMSITLFTNIFNLITIYTAPKVYVLNHLMNYLK